METGQAEIHSGRITAHGSVINKLCIKPLPMASALYKPYVATFSSITKK